MGGAYRHTATLLWPGYTPRLQKSRPEAEPHPPPAGPLLVGRPDSKLSLKKKKKRREGRARSGRGQPQPGSQSPGPPTPLPSFPPARRSQPVSAERTAAPESSLGAWPPGKGPPTQEPLIGSVESRAAGSDQLRDGSRGLCCWRHVVRREKSCPPLRLPVSPLPRTQTCSKKKKASSIITRQILYNTIQYSTKYEL